MVFEPEKERIISQLKWGLVPHWAKDAEIGNPMINAEPKHSAKTIFSGEFAESIMKSLLEYFRLL